MKDMTYEVGKTVKESKLLQREEWDSYLIVFTDNSAIKITAIKDRLMVGNISEVTEEDYEEVE